MIPSLSEGCKFPSLVSKRQWKSYVSVLLPPQSPPFFIREFGIECKYELAEPENEREADAQLWEGEKRSCWGGGGRGGLIVPRAPAAGHRPLQLRASDWRGRSSLV